MSEKYILTQYHIPSALQQLLTIAHISDLHEHDPEPILQLLSRIHPDLIAVTGDSFERHDDGSDPRFRREPSKWKKIIYEAHSALQSVIYCLIGSKKQTDSKNTYRFLREATRIAPVYLSLGNHEHYLNEADCKVIAVKGTRLLDNADCEAEVRGAKISIGGLSSDADLEWLNKYKKKSGYKILLCHHPEYYERYGLDTFDLVLSGHVHGGQWQLRGRGVYAPDQGFFPQYFHGVYDERMIVSAGCANTAVIPRFGNPCEVVEIQLKKS